ncbi:L-serine ammonia-lyase [Acidipropionibacterium acidipropionici]|uniref:L-serine dehydratase n=2 Tax=Actinomycetes TaxID=1760 RepID=A0AAC8YGZ2_9ACTN|nr:L-serine ammonia-lyase [Acidipropionibacterium acidipropionici]AMS06395.1 serine dehydratase [Acidipropionibacterium acidipropionici]AOZ47846.1 L-serine ammonia-lyase [Acidipropionibacterium acidipropionici]AZP38810.1 L-serine ammonia-lyase [Acidipropionibacterium acidipropionici]QCV95774.1 L-serine ammonia-lyase [Acidipropionibacterium acidipropionici]
MAVSVFDIFKIGIGPSSSHTVGPMRAARVFAGDLASHPRYRELTRVRAQLFGSLGSTGHGHGSEGAVLLGLEGEDPATVDTDAMRPREAMIRTSGRIALNAARPDESLEIGFDADEDLVLYRTRSLPFHPNGMIFTAWADGDVVAERTFYSIGGGFVVEHGDDGHPAVVPDSTPVPFPFRTGAQLLEHCVDNRMSIPEVTMANEVSLRSEDPGRAEERVREGLLHIWEVMHGCVERGCSRSGVLPGGLHVRRRAMKMHHDLERRERTSPDEGPFGSLDWLTVWALAVNEENAAGGRIVTAPTNGAAGIVPAALHLAVKYLVSEGGPDSGTPGVDTGDDNAIVDFLLTAGAIGTIFQQSASISGAEVGCQGEVGVACSMAAAGLAQVMGATVHQVCNAAEIGLEHHLGLTCDPVGGLVQIPCIERNAVGAIKALTAARLACAGDEQQIVSLDQVIRTMMQTGKDMKVKYKETARGGLAVNIVEC